MPCSARASASCSPAARASARISWSRRSASARLPRPNTVLGRGNLAEAERRLQEILADARAAGEQDAEARAEHGIAVALYHMGHATEAIPHAWHAFELYEEDDSRMRALNDV